jgi:hypothetical protein
MTSLDDGHVPDKLRTRTIEIDCTSNASERSRPAADATREANGAVYGERLK